MYADISPTSTAAEAEKFVPERGISTSFYSFLFLYASFTCLPSLGSSAGRERSGDVGTIFEFRKCIVSSLAQNFVYNKSEWSWAKVSTLRTSKLSLTSIISNSFTNRSKSSERASKQASQTFKLKLTKLFIFTGCQGKLWRLRKKERARDGWRRIGVNSRSTNNKLRKYLKTTFHSHPSVNLVSACFSDDGDEE